MSPRVEASVWSDRQQMTQYRSDDEMNTTAYAMIEVKGTKRSDNNTTTRRMVVIKSQRVGCLFSARDKRRDPKSYRSKAGKSRQMHSMVTRRQSARRQSSLFLITDFAILCVKDHARESIAGKRHALRIKHALRVQEWMAERAVITAFQNCRDSSFRQMPFLFINSSDNYQNSKRVHKIFWRNF
jgi:hypothetical protein